MELYEQTFIVTESLFTRGSGPIAFIVTLRAIGEFDGNLMASIQGRRVALVEVDS